MTKLAGDATPATAEQKNATMTETRMFLTKFLEAALGGDAETVQRMAGEYASQHNLSVYDVLTQFKDARQRTALHFACQSAVAGEKDIVHELILSDWAQEHKLLDKDASSDYAFLRSKDSDGITPLMLAAQSTTNTLQRVQTLLQAGGNKLALARSKDGATALHYAAGAGASKEVILALFESGKVAAKTNSKQGGTPLHWAAASKTNVTETMNALLSQEVSADVDAKNDKGLTALIIAVASGNDPSATCLIQHGADRGILLGGNLTVYHMAADTQMVQTLKALLEVDLGKPLDDPDNLSAKCCSLQNDRGHTPFDLAVLESDAACVKLLLPFSQNVPAVDLNDEEAIHGYMTTRKTELEKISRDKPEPLVNEKEAETPKDEIAKVEEEAKRYAIESQNKTVSKEEKEEALQHKQAGNSHFTKHEYDLAIPEYTKAITSDPTDATFYSNRSASYMALQRHKDALFDAIVCRHLNPDWTKGCYRLAVARLALGKYEDAALAAWEGVQIDKDNEELKRLLQKAVKQGRKEHEKTAEEER